ncbi:MAG: type III pantothenate kinase [Prolixibacteraceae bacterium]
MNLVLDIGNSRTKAAIFSKGEMVGSSVFTNLSVKEIQELVEEFQGTEQVILSSVASVPSEIGEYLEKSFATCLVLNSQTPVPITIGYLTPETLGLDRIAAAVGAHGLYPEKDLLVIDAGTAVTFDLIEKNGQFLGGNISPGMRSRFRALNDYTQNLPLIQEADQWPSIGQTTEEAIRAGVLNGMIFEIDGMIDLLKNKYPGIQPVLTGGDAGFFERRLKNHIFVKFEITLIGLNRILEYNVEKL